MKRTEGYLKCSFCGKGQMEVRKLVAGPGVYICDECAQLCGEIMDDEFGVYRISFRVEVAADKIVVVEAGKEFEAPMTTTDPAVWSRFCQYVKERAQAAEETSEIRRLKADLAAVEKKEQEVAQEIAALVEKIAKARAQREVATKPPDNLSAKSSDNLPIKNDNLPAKLPEGEGEKKE